MRRGVLVLIAAAGLLAVVAGSWLMVAQQRATTGGTGFAPGSNLVVVEVHVPWWTVALIVLGAIALASSVVLLAVRRRD